MTDRSSFPPLPESAEDLYEHAPSGYLYTTPEGRIQQVNQTFLEWTGYARQDLIEKKFFADLLTVGGKMYYETHVFPLQQMHGFINEVALDVVSSSKQHLPMLVSMVQKKSDAGAPLFNRITLFSAVERRRYEQELLASRNRAEHLAREVSLANLAMEKSQARLTQLNEHLESEVADRAKALVQAERQLEQRHKLEAIGRLAGGVAHDFNNLLAGILGITEEAIEMLPADHPARVELLEVMKAGQKAVGLTKQLLAVGRQEIVHPVKLDLNKALRDSEVFLKHSLGPEFHLILMLGDVASIELDPHQLEQIIMNLVLNARDASAPGADIEVRTFQQTHTESKTIAHGFVVKAGEYSGFSVTDSGSGIAGDVIERIFDPFFTTKPKDKGTGLGLATVSGIVQQNAGFMEVDTRPNRGTRFTVCFPTAVDKPQRN